MTKIAVIQMDIEAGNKEKNLKESLKKIEEASLKGAEIICLPELFNTGFLLEEISLLAEEKEETINVLANTAKEKNIIILGGSIAVKEEGKIFNKSYVINREGKIEGSYRKVHLFPLMREDKYFESGKSLTIVEMEPCSIGLMICYDIRFPEIARILCLNGAEILFVPAGFPNPRMNHWRLLLQARAVENQVYVIGVNRVGHDNTSTYFGHSMIVDPWGEIISECGDKEEIIYGDINPEQIKKVRKKIPCLQNRKEDVYTLRGNINTY